jgi:uncharacterized protein YdeI (YjbR/CyaY-like superfamily)
MESAGETINGLEILLFQDQQEWDTWLEQNQTSSPGLWLKIAKKGGGLTSVSYDQALESALCYGWIDGQKKPYDTSAWLQKFNRRGLKSIWSKNNRQKAEALIASGSMKPGGLAAVEQAKANGQWDAAYESQKSIGVPEDLERELEARPQAKAFFGSLNSVNRYAILHRLQVAKKPEVRARMLQQFIEMLERGEKIYP